MGDRPPLDRANLAEQKVGVHKVFDGAAAADAHRDAEFEAMGRGQGTSCPVGFDQSSGLVVMIPRQRDDAENLVRGVFH